MGNDEWEEQHSRRVAGILLKVWPKIRDDMIPGMDFETKVQIAMEAVGN